MKRSPPPIERDWIPRRRGSIYCSPLCGGNCTYAAYLKARENARSLARRCGTGYTPETNENLGWYFYAESPCKRIHVHQHRLNDFSAYLNHAGAGGGQYVASGSTPAKAIANVIKAAKIHIAEIASMIEGLE